MESLAYTAPESILTLFLWLSPCPDHLPGGTFNRLQAQAWATRSGKWGSGVKKKKVLFAITVF